MEGVLAPEQAASAQRRGPKLGVAASRIPRAGADGSPRANRPYRLCILHWLEGEARRGVVRRMSHAANARDPRSVLIWLDSTTQLLLLADDVPGAPSREQIDQAVRLVIERARTLQPGARIRAVVGDRLAPGEPLTSAGARLHRRARLALAGSEDDLIWAGRHSLACLLETVEPRHAAAVVEGRLAGLRAYDREHGTNLQRVLELALDHPDRKTAAGAAYMHRNTFRRQLAKAFELVDADLSDPEERLALHVALKLRGLVERRCDGDLPSWSERELLLEQQDREHP